LRGRPAGALAGIAMILLLAAPARAGLSPSRTPHGALDGPESAFPVRDVVLGKPSAGAARIAASASLSRYPVNDGSGATIAVAVTAACQASCTATDPQQIANFIGTLIHGPEIDLLTVQLDTPYQLAFDCGAGAQACYYGGENKIVIQGDDTPAPDGASREFVLAHEYGHHVARHRMGPAPFLPIDWGTPRWASYENVCRKRRAGALFPGNEGRHYFRDPGEAFAEAFARNRFPDTGVRWRWLRSLKPDAAAFRAIRRDTLDPWLGRTSLLLSGRVPRGRRAAVFRSFRTPLDGAVSLRPSGSRRFQFNLKGPAGRVLRTSRRDLSFRHQLNFTVCGQSHLGVAIRSARHSGHHFRLRVQRP
jgi:hypothetical protein